MASQKEALPRTPLPGQWNAKKLGKGYIGSYQPFSVMDGEGIRCSLYVSGCLFACPECFNSSLWSFRAGEPYSEELEERILNDLSKPYVQGLTLLGGEPFLNTTILIPLLQKMKDKFGTSKDVWCWSGYTWETLISATEDEDKKILLALIDVLVDGPFLRELKDSRLRFRGSSNQRLIAVKESLREGNLQLWR